MLEVIGGAHLAKAVEAVAVGGHICQIGALDGFELSAPAMPLMSKDVTIHGIGTGSRKALERLVMAVDRAKIKPVIEASYGFTDLPAALDHLDKGPFGNVMIEAL